MARRGIRSSIAKKYGISKKGWIEEKKARRGKRSKSSKVTKTKKKSVRRMAKKKRRRRGGFSTRTIEKWLGVAMFLAPAVIRGMAVYSGEKNAVRAVTEGALQYGGIQDGKFSGTALARAWTPSLMFTLASVGIRKLRGIIRSF